MTSAFVVALLLAAAPSSSSGRISYVTAGDAYLDVGTADGLAVGAKVDITRRKRKVSTCEVVQASPHHAVCKSDRASPGDRVTFPFTATPAPVAVAVKPRERLPTSAELDARRARLTTVPLEKVLYKKARRVAGPSWSARASATLRTQVWATSRGDVFVRPSLDAAAHVGLGFFPGMFASTALRVTGDVVAPKGQRFRPDDVYELYVWDAAVGLNSGPVVGAVGRFRPRKTPGMYLLDGAQAGLSVLGGSLEVGAYAGAIPDLITLAPAADRLTAGAYFGLDLQPVDGVMILPRARMGLVTTPDFGTLRAEAEGQAQLLWRDTISVGGSVRSGIGGTADALPSLDAARVDTDIIPIRALRLHAAYRYLAPLAVDFDAISNVPPVGGAHHGDASARFEVAPWLSLGVNGGAGYDIVTDVVRGYVGPEVGLPHAFGSLGGLDLGYLEELGFWSGRTAFVSTTLSPFSVLRVVTRASYFESEALGDSLREGALMVLVDAPVLPWLSLRARGQGQQALAPLDGSKREALGLMIVDVGVSGSL